MTDFEKSTKGLQQIMAAAPVGIAVINGWKQVVYANPEAEKIFGARLKPGAPPPRCGDFIACVHRHDDPRGCGYTPFCQTCPLCNGLDDILGTDSAAHPREGETSLARDLGQRPFWIKYKIGVLEWAGNPWAILTIEDITQRKQAEEDLLESEKSYQATFNSIGDGVIVTDINGQITRMNPVAEHLTGWKRKEAVGRPLTEIFHIINAHTRQPAVNPVPKVLSSGHTVGLANHTALISRDGREYQIADSCAPIRDSKNQTVGTVLVFRDVTEEYLQRRRIAENEKFLRTVIDSLGHPFAVINADDYTIEMANSAFGEKAVGKKCHAVSHRRGTPCDGDRHPCPLPRIRQTGQAVITEHKHFNEQGKPIDIELHAHPIFDDHGRLLQIIEQEIDITERKRTEQMKEIRLNLIGFASGHSLDELLTRALDEVGRLVNSPIGFYHFVDTDQKTLTLQQWSSATLQNFCTTPGKGLHYSVDQAGVWVDCVHQRRAVIHNDYASLPHRKGLPAGHAPVIRELVTPVMRNNRIVAILGVGNKPMDYTQADLETVSYLADVTWHLVEEKRVQEALRKSEAMFRNLFTQQAAIKLLIDPEDGHIIDANAAAANFYGWSREQLKRMKLHEINTLPLQELKQEMKRASDSGQTHFEFRHRRADGTIRDVEIFSSRIETDSKPLLHSIIHDVTPRKEAEKNLLESNQRLEETTRHANDLAIQAQMANAAKGEFLANMSHEIRTPINGVIGMTALLLDTELTDEQRRYAEIVCSSSESLLSLINDILDFSKIEAGKLELETLDFDLPDLLDDFAAGLAVHAHGKGLEFICAADPEVPSLLRGDPGRLRQILTNIGGNAVKFTHSGEVAIRVSMEAETDDDVLLRFSVRDTGIGIPENKRELLFDKFSQVDASITRRYGGTGLGLAISRELTQAMGGEIGFVSEEGKGSEFWFTIRLGKQANCRPNGETAALEALQKVRVLVVDDNATSREVLTSWLTLWRMRPAQAADGATAIRTLHQAQEENDPFSIAIIDLHMPDMDGETLGRLLHEDPRLATTRLILLISLGSRRDSRLFSEIGFAGYLTKPVRRQELENALLQALSEDSGTRPSYPAALHDTKEIRERLQKGGKRILLAEDNITNQQVALGILKKFGLQADAVGNGDEAVKAFGKGSYDLVLMDVQMPVMDGLEATRKIRTRYPAADVPIIAMTAHVMRDDRGKCLAAGMNDYLSKPVMPKALADILEKWLPKVKGKAKKGAAAAPEKKLPKDRVWDKAGMLARLMDDEELARSIAATFLEDIPRQLKLLEEHLGAQDLSAAERVAHSVQGAAANMGGEALRTTARELKRSAESGDLARSKTLLSRMGADFDQLRQTIIQDLLS
jgi:PAS domain S-box-containing protein